MWSSCGVSVVDSNDLRGRRFKGENNMATKKKAAKKAAKKKKH
jgi:hypothetical protein